MEAVGDIKVFSHFFERIGDQVVDMPVPQTLEERSDECTQELIIEQLGNQIVDVPLRQIMPESMAPN